MDDHAGKHSWDPSRAAEHTEFGPDAEESLETAGETSSLFHPGAMPSVPAIRLVIHIQRHKSTEFLWAYKLIYFYLAIYCFA